MLHKWHIIIAVKGGGGGGGGGLHLSSAVPKTQWNSNPQCSYELWETFTFFYLLHVVHPLTSMMIKGRKK